MAFPRYRNLLESDAVLDLPTLEDYDDDFAERRILAELNCEFIPLWSGHPTAEKALNNLLHFLQPGIHFLAVHQAFVWIFSGPTASPPSAQAPNRGRRSKMPQALAPAPSIPPTKQIEAPPGAAPSSCPGISRLNTYCSDEFLYLQMRDRQAVCSPFQIFKNFFFFSYRRTVSAYSSTKQIAGHSHKASARIGAGNGATKPGTMARAAPPPQLGRPSAAILVLPSAIGVRLAPAPSPKAILPVPSPYSEGPALLLSSPKQQG